jgi:hypothetical protein
MAQTSWPFHNGTTGTPVLEDEWSIMARTWAGSGVIGTPGDASLQVYADSSGRQVFVRSGRAGVRGHFYDNDADVALAIGANTSGNPRIDRVVLRLDPSADSAVLAVRQGTAAAVPSAPTLTTTDTGTYEVTLAQVYVANGAAVIAAGNVTDERVYLLPAPMLAVSARRPLSPAVGQAILETDTGAWRMWNGSAWVDVADPTSRAGIVPIGSVVAYGGTSAPTGWHLCDGSAHGSAALATVLGSANTPDLRSRFILGTNPGTHEKGTIGPGGSAQTWDGGMIPPVEVQAFYVLTYIIRKA